MSTQPSPITPPRYQWTATTAHEALAVIGAAKKLIEAHVATLAPDGQAWKTEKEALVGISVDLDLGPILQQINDRRTVAALFEGPNGDHSV